MGVATELFKNDEAKYGASYKHDLLEQYKLLVKMADKISARRHAANTFFLTVITALLPIIAAVSKLGPSPRIDLIWILTIAIVGGALCISWHLTIDSYRRLNEAKFTVINAIEERLPAAMYQYEWNLLGGKRGDSHRQLTDVEKFVPIVFFMLYIGVAFFVFILAWHN